MSVNGVKQPLDANNLLLRGSTLRKTPWAIGVAVNVGQDAKIVQNMTKAPRKVCGALPGGGGRKGAALVGLVQNGLDWQGLPVERIHSVLKQQQRQQLA